MTPIWLPALILFGGLVLGLTLGLPMAITLGSSAVVVTLIFQGSESLSFVATNTFGMMRNLLLVGMPLFIFMATLLERSGVADDLYTAMRQWLGPLPGGLAMATVVICTVIAALSGVSSAGVVTMGIIALPVMLKSGYDKTIAIGPIMAGGVLGILVPPSVSFILYAMLTKVSIAKLLAGGLLPGLLLSSLYLVFIGVRCSLQPHLGPPIPVEERVNLRQKLSLARSLILPVVLILAVLGSIFSGIASPTEAAAMGAAGALVCAAINRRFNWQMLKEACLRTFTFSTMIMWILFGASCFSSIFIVNGGPGLVRDFVLGLNFSPIGVVFLMMVVYFILGCFVDEVTIMLITIPIFLPILTGLGFDPVWFGVLFIVNMQMAYLTPPFGFTLFYMRGVAPREVSLLDIYRSVVPFVIMQWLAVLLVMFFPQLALWLPDIAFGLK